MKLKIKFFVIAFLFIKIVFDFRKELILIKKKGYKKTQKKMKKTHEKRAQQLYDISIKFQGGLIKLSQYLSTRRDIFPEPYLKILSPLQDNVPAVSFDRIEKVLKSEYNDYTKIFKKINPTPLASASLGQIHKAHLLDGTEVVLKILKPGIDEIIDTDLAVLFYVFKLISNFQIFKDSPELINLLNEFITVTGDELNFKREIFMATEFKKYLSKFEYLTIPHIYKDISTDKIIVMEYISGNKVNEIEKWTGSNNDPILVTERIIEIYMEQFLHMPLIHFDPHPGNILITNDSNLVLLDFGMSGKITNKIRAGIHEGIFAYIKKDYRKIVDIIDDLDFIKKGENKYTILPLVEFFFEDILNKIKLNRESIHTLDLSPIKNELADMIYNLPFTIPMNWAYIGKTVSTLVGIIIELNPDFNAYKELTPYAKQFLGENIEKVIQQSYKSGVTNINIIRSFPERIDTILGKIERGDFLIKIDYSNFHNEIDRIKTFTIKTMSILISSISGVLAYIFYEFNKMNVSYMFIGILFLGLTIALTFKKINKKEKLRKIF